MSIVLKPKLTPILLISTLLLAGTSLLFADQKNNISGLRNNNDIDQLFKMSLSELITLNIYTASKKSEPIINSPSIVTVVNSEEVDRRGYRSLSEILESTVGFYTYDNASFPEQIGNRGLASGMQQYLFLIDGHSINSVNNFGPFSINGLPIISQYKEIEIIRGPGSILWGADAAMGIVNFIPKTGADINGLEISVDASSKDDQHSANILFGHNNGELDVMTSFNWFDSNGYGYNRLAQSGFDNSFRTVANKPSADVKDETDNWQIWDSDWEFYTKVSAGGFSLSLRSLEHKVLSPAGSSGEVNTLSATWDSDFIELAYTQKLGSKTDISTKIIYDSIEQHRLRTGNFRDDSYEEENIGIDISFNTELENHHLRYGLKYVDSDSGPNTRETNSGAVFLATSGSDITWSAYLEDRFIINEKISLIIGGRYDDNNFREDGSTFLPRFGTVYQFSNDWTVKYVYNTGYYRPAIGQSKRTSVTNATEAQETQSHDFQFLYFTDDLSFDITFFYLHLESYIAFINSVELGNGFKNIANIRSKGVEMTLRKTLNEQIVLVGNYAYTKPEIADYLGFDQEALGISASDDVIDASIEHILDLGVDLFINDALTGSIQSRYVSGEQTRDRINGTVVHHNLDSRVTLNANLRYQHQDEKHRFTANVYIKNVLDDEDERAMSIVSGGVSYTRGRSIGANVSYHF